MAKNKVPKPSLLTTLKIPQIDQGEFHKEEPKFSFKYYDHDHDVFSVMTLDINEFHLFFDRMRHYCRLKWSEMTEDDYHFHAVDFERTAFPKGFENLPEKIREQITARQFKIQGGFRIFGFFDKAIFYIVWFDEDHSVYPDEEN